MSNTGMQLLRNRTGSAGLGGNGQSTRLTALDRIAAAGRRPCSAAPSWRTTSWACT
ncbi:hypothetical protein ACFYWU_37870 [Streptomyces chrestomyceticus]|uniref:hypothetical protein n=1 Tax=Streptomyces chrestomyceticus TaxID=68185 RepID=UPI0036B8D6EA